jgi:hypothetical protein
MAQPTPTADQRKYKVDTMTRATGTVLSGNRVMKRKSLYPEKMAPIPAAKDPMAKTMKQRKDKEQHGM